MSFISSVITAAQTLECSPYIWQRHADWDKQAPATTNLERNKHITSLCNTKVISLRMNHNTISQNLDNKPLDFWLSILEVHSFNELLTTYFALYNVRLLPEPVLYARGLSDYIVMKVIEAQTGHSQRPILELMAIS